MRIRFKGSHIGLYLLLAMSWLVYDNGLSGPFLFDDYANLPALGADGPVVDLATLARYVTSGIADPTGRPVAMASFLVDAHDWPAAPYPFKRTNLILHLTNGVLLFCLLSRLGKGLSPESDLNGRHADAAALLATGFWILHPLFVSTTLYVVQREAMLPATFTLLGLLGWLGGRERLARGHISAGMIWAIASLVTATGMSVLSKANGILLPALVLVIEFGLLRRANRIRLPQAAHAHTLVLAGCGAISATVACGLFWLGIRGFTEGIGDQRPWTLGQRLLTEPRVLWDYLRLLWLPRPYTAGVFNDQFEASVSLLQPWTTLPAIAGLAGLVVLAIGIRRHAPVLATAVVFFLVGQSVESTTIPLELYFEHRNYLPSLLMFWPIARWLTQTKAHIGGIAVTGKMRALLGGLLLIGLASMTYANASLWGNGRDQARLWAALNPQSPRAQVNAAQSDLDRGDPAKAVARLAPLLDAHPDEVQLALNLLAARCAMHTATPADVQNASQAMTSARDPGALLVSWFGREIVSIRDNPCPGLDLEALSSLIKAGAQNPKFPAGRRQDLKHVEGMIALEQRDPAAALAAFDDALAIEPREGIAMQQAAILGSSGYPAEGIRHLETFDTLTPAAHEGIGMPMLHEWVLKRQGYWPRERARLESTLRHDLQDSHHP
ncbi:hypothetical protein [Luteibacter sp. 22Crub2.1]|uniref:hypothetical protein n=1 Tax=Luteibacter sp. 22Crub2.1 TaxID=1283288 RepID=UPI0009A6A16C|nr:hypothetical protein [Luteibacter sp. 22Crub2.1]SKB42768.1 hypothetical protein SAMN05660880_01008 [Luteibacter sp. 22Crub2.1]